MPDPFFATQKPRKRKRDTSSSSGPGRSSTSTNGHRGPKAPRPNGTHSGTTNGRPTTNGAGPSRTRGGKTKPIPPKRTRDEELSGSEDGADGAGGGDLDSLRASTPSVASASEDETETPAQKRLRLAQLYLKQVETEEREKAELGGWDAEELDREIIGDRLRKDVEEDKGKVCVFVGERIDMHRIRKHTTRRCQAPITAALASEDGSTLYAAEKNGSITTYSLQSGSALKTVHKVRHNKNSVGVGGGKGKGKGKGDAEGHTDEIWALAIAPDGRTLASGGKDRRIGVWDLSPSVAGRPSQPDGSNSGSDPIKWRTSFGGHRDSITGLSFLKNPTAPPTLYTSSADRTLRAYATTPGAAGFVEALFGHQDIAVSLDVLRGETPVSVGARDKTVRYWKIRDETQLVFRGGGGGGKMRRLLEGGALDGLDEEEEEKEREKRRQEEGRRDVEGSLECVAMLDERTFLTGGNSGSISLWSTTKKKPVYMHAYAHGLAETQSSTEGVVRSPRPVLSLGALRYSDVFSSGSWDGSVRLWRVEAGLRRFVPIGAIDAPGVVNSLQIVRPPRTALVGRLWAKAATHDRPNGVHVNGDVAMDSNEEEAEEEEEEEEDKHAEPPLVLVAALGREPRMGRWIVMKEGVQNRAMVCLLPVRRPVRS